MHYRTLFLSDFHLGTQYCQTARLLNFLDNNTADRYYLVGDIIDEWARNYSSNWYWNYWCDEIMKKFTDKDRDVIYVPGNHDQYGIPLTLFPNIYIGESYRHVTADGKKFLVMHGHQQDRSVLSMSWLKSLGLLKLANPRVDGTNNRIIKHFDKVAKQRLVDQAIALGLDGVICGHTHDPHMQSFKHGKEIKYINCGDWIKNCTAAAEYEDGSFAIVR